MPKIRPRVPVGLLISIVILLILGAIAGPVIQSNATEEQLATNVLLAAIPFILIFVAILLAFIAVIALVGSVLNNRVSEGTYRWVERIIIAGIVFGVIGMFQPWLFVFYRYGFLLLLFSTLAFILWSHVSPERVYARGKDGSLAIHELGNEDVEHG
jgi:hypothetical protein